MSKISVLIVYSLIVLPIFSQNEGDETAYKLIYQQAEDKYGIDQVLVNGITYENKYFRAEGHPFLGDDVFYSGSLVFRGRSYPELKMKYDVFEQQLVIKYSLNNKVVILIPPYEFISAFSFNDKQFRKYSFESTPSRFYQVLGASESLQCLYLWKKKRSDSEHLTSHFSYKFSDGERSSYLLIDGKLESYSGNSSFLKLLPVEIRAEVKTYLKTKKIKLAKSEDKSITELLVFCTKLKTVD